MTWRSFLQSRSRQPAFLWRMVIWILAAGIGVGFVAEKIWKPQTAAVSPVEKTSEKSEQVTTFAQQGEWSQLWWALPAVVYDCFQHSGPTILAVVAGCCWLVFLWQALNTPGLRDTRFWLCLLAVALGVLSVWPTIFLMYWQEYAWTLGEGEDLISGLRYFVLGVGLREEFAKLVCVLPLMPVMLRLRSELSAMLVSACVGLGFAMTENINYFVGSGGTAAIGRFLLANPFHMTLTGLSGLALYRALQNPRGWGSHSLGVFGAMIIAHGLYDAFIVVPALAEYGLITTIIFALVVYQFFHELRELRPKFSDVVSLSATFLLGVSVLAATTFVYLSATLGMSIAFDTLAAGVTGLAVMVYLFLREMPETMVTV